MKQISTPATSNTETGSSEDKEQLPAGTEINGALLFPSIRSIRNILAYSRSIDVISSELLGNFEIHKN